MSVTEGISGMSNSCCDVDVLMDHIRKNFDALESELNANRYEGPKKHKL